MEQPIAPAVDSEDILIITRTFDAPRDVVFNAYADGEEFVKWWGPKGFPVAEHTMDFRPGGSFHYCLRSAAGNEMWGRLTYHEIERPERISFVTTFSNADGGVERHPLSDTWPLEVYSELIFEEQDGKTHLSMRAWPINANDVERETFRTSHDQVRGGTAATMSQLDAYLAALTK